MGTTKEPPTITTGKGVPPPTTTTIVEDDDDEDIADGTPPVDASNVANAEVVGASGADLSRVVVGGGVVVVGSGGGKQAPPESMVKPKEPLLVTIVACTT